MKVWYVFTILNIKEWKKKQRPTYTQYVHSMAIKYKITTNNMSWDVKILSYSFLFIFFPWALQKKKIFAWFMLVPNLGYKNYNYKKKLQCVFLGVITSQRTQKGSHIYTT